MSKLLQSRKFLLALVAIIVQVLLIVWPDTRPYADNVGGVLFALVGIGVISISLEDSVQAWANRPRTTEEAIRLLITEALSALFPTTTTTVSDASGTVSKTTTVSAVPSPIPVTPIHPDTLSPKDAIYLDGPAVGDTVFIDPERG